MRAVQRAADKVCCSVEEKQTFMKLGSLIMAEENAETVQQIFATMAGEQTLKLLPKRLQQQENTRVTLPNQHDNKATKPSVPKATASMATVTKSRPAHSRRPVLKSKN